MNPETERAILAEIEAARAAGGQVYVSSGLGDDPLPSHAYLAADRYRAEIERVFWRSWIPVARVSELAEKGSWLLRSIERAEVIITRDEGGALSAFHNTCRHRGSAIVNSDGCGKRLVCPYHLWSYELDGRLAAVPERIAYPPDLDLSTLRLAEVDVATGWGWIWVRVTRGGPSLEAFLGPELVDDLGNWRLDELDRKGQVQREGAYAWQIGVEVFLEPQHVASVHRRSVNPVVQHRHTVMHWWGDHSRMVIDLRDRRVFEPEGVLGRVAAGVGISVLPGLNTVQRGTNFVYAVWPSLIFNLLPNHVTVIQILPVAPGRCKMTLELYGAPTESEEQASFWKRTLDGYAGLIDEDDAACAAVQRGLSGGYLPQVNLSHYDRRIRHFRSRLDAWLTR